MNKLYTAALLTSVAHVVPFADVLDVITIQTENGPVRINRSDFDPSKHTAVNSDEAPAAAAAPNAPAPIFDAQTGERLVPLADTSNPNLNPPNASPPNVPPAASTTPPPPPPTTPTPTEPVERFVTSKGTGKNQRWYVADKTGTSVAGFNADGYATEAEAIAADKAGLPPA